MDKISDTGDIIIKTCQNVVAKCVGVLAYFVIQFSFGDISRDALIAILMLTVFDFISAIWAVRVTKEKVKSAKVFRSAWKIGLYFILISAGHFTEIVIGTNLFIDEVIMAFLAVTELISILENIEKAGYSVPIGLLKKLKDIKKTK